MTTEKLTEQDIDAMAVLIADHIADAGQGTCIDGIQCIQCRLANSLSHTIADLRRLREENERLARELSIITDGNAEMRTDLTAATERAERAERERDGLLAECRSWRNEAIGERTSYDLRLEAAIAEFDPKEEQLCS